MPAMWLPLPWSRLQAPRGRPPQGPGAASFSGLRYNLKRLILRAEIKLILEDLIFREVLFLLNSEMSYPKIIIDLKYPVPAFITH